MCRQHSLTFNYHLKPTSVSALYAGIVLQYRQPLACLVRERDTKFTAQFDEVLKAEGLKVKVLPVQSPNLNSRCERIGGLVQWYERAA